MAAVVAAFELGNLAFLRKAARKADCVQGGLGTRIDETDSVERVDPATHLQGDFALDSGGSSEGNALFQLLAHCRIHGGVAVPEDLGSVVIGAIGIAAAVRIPEVTTLAADHGQGMGRIEIGAFSCTGSIGAAGCEELARAGTRLAITRYEFVGSHANFLC